MKSILLILVMCLSYNSEALSIRDTFHQDMFTEEGLQSIIDNKDFPTSTLSVGYKCVCKTMLADYMFLPTTKLSYFNDGKQFLEKVISTAPENVELRYLRLLVQLNSPSFLGYQDNINDDLVFYISNLKSYAISLSWKKKFTTNLLAGEHLSKEHKNKLVALKAEL